MHKLRLDGMAARRKQDWWEQKKPFKTRLNLTQMLDYYEILKERTK